MKVTAMRKKAGSNWNIKVFERIQGNRYLLHEEDIQEVSFPTRKIVRALRVHFLSVEIIDTQRKSPSTESERLHFICKKCRIRSGRGSLMFWPGCPFPHHTS